MSRRDYEVAIAGAGPSGLVAALAIRHALRPSAGIVVIDPALGRPNVTNRTYAISPGSRNMLERLGVWRRLARSQPITNMEITDSLPGDQIRQSFLQFQAELDPALGWIVEHDDLMFALNAQVEANDIRLMPEQVDAVSPSQNFNAITTTAGRSICAGLLVASDGGNSRIRELLHIPVTCWSYKRSAIVITVAAEFDHAGKAIQHFLPAGTFALLPMTNSRFSIVWVEEDEEAHRLVNGPSDILAQALQSRARYDQGELTICSEPELFPLKLQIAQRLHDQRTVLVADAAHVMHPLAGQGLNLGFSDIAYLSECISQNTLLGLDIGNHSMLHAYARSRHFESTQMLAATDALFRLFISKSGLIRPLRDLGLSWADSSPRMKKMFSNIAAGQDSRKPSLLQPIVENSF